MLQLEMSSGLASHGRNVSAECRVMVRGVRSVREALLHGGNAALVAELGELERELHSKYGGMSARPPPRATHRLQTQVRGLSLAVASSSTECCWLRARALGALASPAAVVRPRRADDPVRRESVDACLRRVARVVADALVGAEHVEASCGEAAA